MATFSITTSGKTDDGDGMPPVDGLGSTVLVHNIRWFIRVRWFVAVALLLAGLVSHFAPPLVTTLGLVPPRQWPWILAVVLAVANLIFWIPSRRLTEATPDRLVQACLWLQIVFDLVIVTITVHFVGSTTTFISFIYLLHIVLACIFFSTLKSLGVTLMAAGLYLLCVGIEILGILPPSTITPIPAHRMIHPGLSTTYAVSAVLIWLTVWYLVATLSKIVRERDRLLEAANQRLVAADEEKNRVVLRTTHDLKAPFSGIESNIQVLKLQYWDQIPEAVRDVVNRIETRGRTLSDRIRDILALGDLRTPGTADAPPAAMDLDAVLKEVLDELGDKAHDRRITIHTDPLPVKITGRARHFTMLFSNLIANAINYSAEGETVRILLRRDKDNVHVLVQDHGIGIPEEALPRIFDEYFRTKEALRINPGSTGLGLAIVKEIVQMAGLNISVTSEVGRGTTFDVAIPASRCQFSEENVPWQTS